MSFPMQHNDPKYMSIEGTYSKHSAPYIHDSFLSTDDEDFDMDQYLDLNQEYQPSNANQSSSELGFSRSVTLDRTPPSVSQQGILRQSRQSQPSSSTQSSFPQNEIFEDMEIDDGQQHSEQKRSENGGGGDILEALSSVQQAPECTRNKDTLASIGIPTGDTATYPLDGHEPRPYKRSRTENEDKLNEGRQDYLRMVLEGYHRHFSIDPSPEQKKHLASTFEMSIEAVDKWFWDQRASKNVPTIPPAIVVHGNTHHSADSSREQSYKQEHDVFTQKGQLTPSETTTSGSNHPNHCTFPNCQQSFKSPSDWKVHEELVHWLQKRYLCLVCAILPANDKSRFSCKFCTDASPMLDDCVTHVMQCDQVRRQQTWKRYHDFNRHLSSHSHEDQNIQLQIELMKRNKDWHYPVESNWPRICTYPNCSQEFRSWSERQEHYPSCHFKNKKSVSSRKSGTSSSRINMPSTSSAYPRWSQEPQDTG
ncbi:hypothetical protein HYFRA_00002072 [Hymenoscyphus fraxineus]|uniref:C2H2-type domain-containing protein n=1 Tax=Hymenoscyphus fraxineus TaxID=746836 RepID=A0A9N9KJU6_9HELO|nr:hypothetical protein HYFRA_00002072 [Hymenoscyphus fraxineus]